MSNKRISLPLWKKYDIVNEVNRRNDTPLSMLAKEHFKNILNYNFEE